MIVRPLTFPGQTKTDKAAGLLLQHRRLLLRLGRAYSIEIR